MRRGLRRGLRNPPQKLASGFDPFADFPTFSSATLLELWHAEKNFTAGTSWVGKNGTSLVKDGAATFPALNATGVNGSQAVLGNGTTDCLVASSLAWTAGDRTILMILNLAAVNAAAFAVIASYNASPDAEARFYINTGQMQAASGANQMADPASSLGEDRQWIHEFVSGGNMSTYKDNVSVGTPTAMGVAPSSPGDFHVFGRGAASNLANVNVRAIALITGTLTSGDRTLWNDYCQADCGVGA